MPAAKQSVPPARQPTLMQRLLARADVAAQPTPASEYAPSGTALTRADPADSGCSVQAFFHVHEALPAQLIQGVFVPGAIYDARIRFANGFADPQRASHAQDGRGMAIKLLGVPHGGTQDFILLNHPLTLLHDFSRYFALMDKDHHNCFFTQLTYSIALGLDQPLLQHELLRNPLNCEYFSTLPYQFGAQHIVKFSVRASSAMPDTVVTKNDQHDDTMYDALGILLRERGYFLTFALQCRTMNSAAEGTAGSEQDVPFVDVATIYIPPQSFSTPEQRRWVEKLSFNPWATLPEYRPYLASGAAAQHR